MPRCVGRRYPDSPIRGMVGCLERPPPHVFQVWFDNVTPPWDAWQGVWHDVPWDPEPGAIFGIDPANRWRKIIIPGRLIEVHQVKSANVWTIFVYLRHGYPGGGVGQLTFERLFPNGFPKWVDFSIVFRQVNPLWVFGGLNDVQIRLGTYDRLPPDFCTL